MVNYIFYAKKLDVAIKASIILIVMIVFSEYLLCTT